MASDPAEQDPVDGDIVKAATARGWHDGQLERVGFQRFDPATKRAEAVYCVFYRLSGDTAKPDAAPIRQLRGRSPTDMAFGCLPAVLD